MSHIIILYKLKLRNKCRFYKSFFSIESNHNCYYLFIIKEFLTFFITSFVLFFFFKNINSFNLNRNSIYLIIFTITFIQALNKNKTIINFILINLDLYRLCSTSFFQFFLKTILYNCISDFFFKFTSILPITIISCMWSSQSLIIIILGLFTGFIIKSNEILFHLTKHIKSNFNKIISIIKSSFGILLIFTLLNIGIKVINTTLYILKILLTSKNYDEMILLNDLIVSITDSLKWIKNIFKNNFIFFMMYFTILLFIPLIYNFIKYIYLWKNKPITNKKYIYKIPDDILKTKSMPFIKYLYTEELDSFLVQLKRSPEIIWWMTIEIIILYNMNNEINKFIFIFWLYYIGNSNYIRAIFLIGNKIFSNYIDNIDLYYWRLSNNSSNNIYFEKLKILKQCTLKITHYQCVFVCILSLIFLSNIFLKLLIILAVLLINKYMLSFNCKFVSFSSFFTFANSCKSELRISNLDENELVEDKFQNLLKLPFTIIPMLVIILNYIYNFLNIYTCLSILCLIIIIGIIINNQINKYIKKAGDILEKVNILD